MMLPPVYIALLFLAVKHFLLECHDLAHIRSKFYQFSSLKDLFTSIPSRTVINDLKETCLYSNL